MFEAKSPVPTGVFVSLLCRDDEEGEIRWGKPKGTLRHGSCLKQLYLVDVFASCFPVEEE